MIPLGVSIHPLGKVAAMAYEQGERYYWFVDKDDVTLMPADVVEPMYECCASAQIEARLRVPATCSELVALLGKPDPQVRALLYQLRKQGRVARLDRCVSVSSRRGRKREFLWAAA